MIADVNFPHIEIMYRNKLSATGIYGDDNPLTQTMSVMQLEKKEKGMDNLKATISLQASTQSIMIS